MPTPQEIKEIFMPLGLCSRCNEENPLIWETFKDVSFQPNESVKLGFCSPECKLAFCAGVKAVNYAL